MMKIRIGNKQDILGTIELTAAGRLRYRGMDAAAAKLLRSIAEELRPMMDDRTGEVVQRSDADLLASLPARLHGVTWAEEVSGGDE